jgi:hypothetical protein
LYLHGAKYTFEPQPVITDGGIFDSVVGWSAGAGTIESSGSTELDPQLIGSSSDLVFTYKNSGGGPQSGVFLHTTDPAKWAARLTAGCIGLSVRQSILSGSYGGLYVRLMKDLSNYFQASLSVFSSSYWKLNQIRDWTQVGSLTVGEISNIGIAVDNLVAGGRVRVHVDGSVWYY